MKAFLGSLLFSLVVWFTFILPDHAAGFEIQNFLRLPFEWPLLAIVLLLLSERLRRVAILLTGFLVLFILFLKAADIGVQAAFQRPFNPYLDVKMIVDGWDLVSRSSGVVSAFFAAAAILCLLSVLIALLLAATRWMTEAEGRTRRLLLVGFCLLSGGSAMAMAVNSPFVTFGVSSFLDNRVTMVVRAVADMRDFERVLNDEATSQHGQGLFSTITGKDVFLIFVESYGRSAVDDERYATVIRPRLEAVERDVAAAGLKSVSAWVTSPTVGGLSWLAHGTLLSGLWVDSQSRYDRLMISSRTSLNRLFSDAGWYSVGVMPAITMDWPEAGYFGYDQVLPAASLGYKGKPFNWVTMPDQYTLSAFQRLVVEPAHARGQAVMAQIALISSHAPWTPVPHLIDWNAVGDGSIFNAQAASGDAPSVVWADPERVRRQYIQTVDYSLATIGSYMARFGRGGVFIILGDHQPASIVTGEGASRAVPIHIITDDASVLERLKAEGFTDGMLPKEGSSERRMDAMRHVLIDVFNSPGKPPG